VKLLAGLLTAIVVVALLALAIYVAVDAKSHLDKSLAYQEMYRRGLNCTATSIANCTGAALINIAASAQELLVGVVELLASAILLIIALITAAAFVKVFAELGRYGY
jgi:hypothetical protein